MKTLIIELKKEKRTGIILLMPTLGLLGGAYALLNFIVRKDTLLSLPLAPMTILLTQLYGMIMTLNLFGIIVAACMIYNIEFKGNAVKKNVCAAYTCSCHVPVQIFDSDHPAFRCRSTSKSGADSNRHYIFARRHI